MRLATLWFTSVLQRSPLGCASGSLNDRIRFPLFAPRHVSRQAALFFCFGGVLPLPRSSLSVYSLEVCFGSLTIKGNISSNIYLYIYVCSHFAFPGVPMMPMMPGMAQMPPTAAPPTAAAAVPVETAASPEKKDRQKITSAHVPLAKMYNKHKVDGIMLLCPAVALAGDR